MLTGVFIIQNGLIAFAFAKSSTIPHRRVASLYRTEQIPLRGFTQLTLRGLLALFTNPYEGV